MDLNEIRRIAERQLGKDTVARIERRLATQAGGPREIISASNIDFQPSASEDKGDEKTITRTTPTKKARRAATFRSSSEVPSRVSKSSVPADAPITHEPRPIAPQQARLSNAAMSASERLLAQAIAGEYRYAMLGLVLGLACIIGGVILCLNGVAGSASWTAKLFGLFQSKINDAAPGVVLFVVGIFFVLVTKPKVKLDKLRG